MHSNKEFKNKIPYPYIYTTRYNGNNRKNKTYYPYHLPSVVYYVLKGGGGKLVRKQVNN